MNNFTIVLYYNFFTIIFPWRRNLEICMFCFAGRVEMWAFIASSVAEPKLFYSAQAPAPPLKKLPLIWYDSEPGAGTETSVYRLRP
jgi:hypothetical protein